LSSISLAEILGTTEGIDTLIKFLEKSSTFTKTGKTQAEKLAAPLWEEQPGRLGQPSAKPGCTMIASYSTL
jgi:hypothetical protein